MSDAYILLGTPKAGGILIIGDHASNRIPDGVVLGIDQALMQEHIAWDIGVADVAEMMVEQSGYAAFLGGQSRLVVDLNRYHDEAGVLPVHSDGVEISGNILGDSDRNARLVAHYHPYHDRLTALLLERQPGLILSLHSFTPRLKLRPNEQRPWEIGVLYNEYEKASKLAIARLEAAGLVVGDQLPYSGKLLNATMNRHAESNNIPYIGIEMRQDLVADANGQVRFAQILCDMCNEVANLLPLGVGAGR